MYKTPKFTKWINSRDCKRVFILKRDSSQTSLKDKFPFYLKNLIQFTKFNLLLTALWTERILRINCEVGHLPSASFASPSVDFLLSYTLPMLLSPDSLRRGADSRWRLGGNTVQKPWRKYNTKALEEIQYKSKSCLHLGSLLTGGSFHSREIIMWKRMRNHLLNIFSILGTLVCMFTYFPQKPCDGRMGIIIHLHMKKLRAQN